MAGKVHDAAEQLSLLVPRADHADFRIGGAGRLDDVGVALPRVRHRQAVLHPKPPIEGDLVFDSLADADERRLPRSIRGTHRLDELLFNERQIFRVGGRRFFVGQLLDQRRGVIELSGHDHARRARRMRVRRADQDRRFGNAAAAVDLAPHLFDRLAADQQRIESDDGHALAAIVPDRGPHLARIVQRAMKRLAVSARLLHADLGRDVTLGKPDLERQWASPLVGRQPHCSRAKRTELAMQDKCCEAWTPPRESTGGKGSSDRTNLLGAPIADNHTARSSANHRHSAAGYFGAMSCAPSSYQGFICGLKLDVRVG